MSMIGRLLSKLRWPALAMIVGLLAALVLGGWWLWATVGSGQSVIGHCIIRAAIAGTAVFVLIKLFAKRGSGGF